MAKSILKIVLIAAVLFLHAQLRWQAVQQRPLSGLLAQYPHCYSRSLSLVAGRGFERLSVAPDSASLPVKRFLDLEVDELSTADLNAYLTSLPNQEGGDYGSYRYVDWMRIGDLYTAGLVWKLCGIRWTALEHFYVGVSTLAGLAVLLTSWRLSRHFSAGLLAALLFALSPYESGQVVRDANPIWFAAFAFLAFTYLCGRFSATANCAAAFLLGIVCMIGYGWRPDSLVIVLFVLLAALFRWWQDGRGVRQASLAGACYLIGVCGVYGVLQSAIESPQHSLAGNCFHVAYFGEEIRADMDGFENSLQVGRDDAKVASDAYAFHDGLSHEPAPLLYSAGYGRICRTMYFTALGHNLHHWARAIPSTLWYAMGGCPGQDQFQGINISAAWASPEMPRLGQFWTFAVRCLSILLPAFFMIGALAVCCPSCDRGSVAAMLVFCGYYTVIWYVLTPEIRHWGILLVPLCIIAGLAPVVLCKMAGSIWSGARRQALLQRRVWLLPVASAGAIVAGWYILCGATCLISAHERAAYVNDILSRQEQAASVAPHLASPQVFLVTHASAGTSIRQGYLLEIEAGVSPGELTCKHLRLAKEQLLAFNSWENGGKDSGLLDRPRKVIWWNSFTETRHRLHPNKKQLFFVSCLRSASGGDTRSYSLQVNLGGDARLVAARQIDLADWKRLPVSTVFLPGEPPGTTPFVGGLTTRTFNQFPATAAMLGGLGMVEIQP
jgi:hypothetical protein